MIVVLDLEWIWPEAPGLLQILSALCFSTASGSKTMNMMYLILETLFEINFKRLYFLTLTFSTLFVFTCH